MSGRNNFLQHFQKMENQKNKATTSLQIKSLTWLKDSHSLFDYESQKVDANLFTFPINSKAISIYRKRDSSNVIAIDEGSSEQWLRTDLDDYQFLTRFQIKNHHSTNKLRLDFDNQPVPKSKKISEERLNTDESNSACENKQEETYLVVKKIKDINNEQQGFKLAPGYTIKLGRVQYFVSEVRESGVVTKARKHNTSNLNIKIFKVNSEEEADSQQHKTPKNACKICLDETETPQNFLFNPCHCTGSCGTVHIDCLTQWIHVKVKKQTIGGTIHFNFNKFECQVCKYQLPTIVQANNIQRELLPIEKPEGNYLILEGACEKVKSVMLIQNVPACGIKLGRGHQCQIRITDISVSRNHAYIKTIGDGFYLFDSKSKFGTLVRTEPMSLELGKLSRAIQIGRTILNLQVRKEHPRQIRPEFLARSRLMQ